MKSGIRIPALAIAVIFMLSVAVTVQAADGPRDQIKQTIDRVLEILRNKELKRPARAKERRAVIRKEIAQRFDFEEMSRRALAVHWQARTADEKREFTSLFSDLLERNYISKIESYSDEKVTFDDQILDGEYASVKTRVVTSKNLEIPIVYKLLKKGDKWAVYDVVIEEVSLVNNYRSQFNKIVRSASYEELVKKMRQKQTDNRSAEGI